MTLYADDAVWYTTKVNQGYEGNLSAYVLPDDFRVSHLGEYKDANGALIEKSSAELLPFALVGEFQTNLAPKRFAFFNCTAGRPDVAGSSKQKSIDPAAFSIPLTTAPTPKDEIVKATITKSDNEAVFNAWLDSVYYNPSAAAFRVLTVTVASSGLPVAGAVVVVGEKIAKTDSSGIARIALPDGAYTALVSAPGYAPDTDTVTVSGAGAGLDISLAPLS